MNQEDPVTTDKSNGPAVTSPFTRTHRNLALTLLATTALAACGGSDDDNDVGSDSACVSGLQAGFKADISDRPIANVPQEGEGGDGEGDGAGAGGGEGHGIGGGDGQYRNVAVTVEDAAGKVFGPATVDDEKGMVTFVHCGEPTLPARITFEGKDIDATYYDEGLKRDVSFFSKRRIGLLTNLDVNTGVTPLTEALYERAQEIGREQGTPEGWKNPTIVGQAQAELLVVINDQLPGIYRLSDLKRLPIPLNLERDRDGSNALADNQNGIYGALLAGLAKTGATTLPASATPALDVAEALILDLRDSSLNLKDANGQLIGTPNAIPYTLDTLWTQTAVSTGETAERTGTGSLLSSEAPIGFVREATVDQATGNAQESTYVLESSGDLLVQAVQGTGTGAEDAATNPTPGVKYSQLMRFAATQPVVALRRDGKGILVFPTASDATTSFEVLPPTGTNFVELMDGGSPVLRLSDGTFVRYAPATQGFTVEPVPEGVLSFTFRPEYSGALTAGDDLLGADPNGDDDNGLCIGSSREGDVKLWRPVFQPGDVIQGVSQSVPDIMQVSSDQSVSLGLRADGRLYHLDANHTVQFLEPDGTPATVLDGNETRELVRPNADPVEITSPKICSLRAPYAIGCDGQAYEVQYERFVNGEGAVQGAGPVTGVSALPIPSPVWRTRSNRGNNLVFLGTDGVAYNPDGSVETLLR
ncbi:MAG: hypothetical protein AB8C46_10830 [Burkholderiaceae bacterium]